MDKPDLTELKMPELVEMAKARGINTDGLKKRQLIDLIEASTEAPVYPAAEQISDTSAAEIQPDPATDADQEWDIELGRYFHGGAVMLAGWLTTRDRVASFGATEDSSVAADLVGKFASAQGWGEPIIHPWAAPVEPPVEDVAPSLPEPTVSVSGISLPIRVWSMVFELISLHYDGRVSFGPPRIKKYAEVEWVVSVDQSTWTVLVVNNGNPSKARDLRTQIDRLWATRGTPATPEYTTTKTRAQIREEAAKRREQNLEAAQEIDAKIEVLQLEFTEATTTVRYEIPMAGWGDVTIQVPV